MRFGSTAKVLADCKLQYYRISECAILAQVACARAPLWQGRCHPAGRCGPSHDTKPGPRRVYSSRGMGSLPLTVLDTESSTACEMNASGGCSSSLPISASCAKPPGGLLIVKATLHGPDLAAPVESWALWRNLWMADRPAVGAFVWQKLSDMSRTRNKNQPQGFFKSSVIVEVCIQNVFENNFFSGRFFLGLFMPDLFVAIIVLLIPDACMQCRMR